MMIWISLSNHIKEKPFLLLARIGFLSLFSFLVMISYDISLRLVKLKSPTRNPTLVME